MTGLEAGKNGSDRIETQRDRLGYIQDKAQNHALCRSAFIAAGQKLMFEDACCVQASQGGDLEEHEQWFFILPLQLREKALQLRGEELPVLRLDLFLPRVNYP